MPPLRIACALLLLGLAPPAGEVQLPEGPNARAFAGVGPETEAIALGAQLAGRHAVLLDGADRAAVWRAWGQTLERCAASEEESPSERASLALFALEQGRWSDAWAHLERLGGHPEWSAAVLPRLLPGAPAGTPPGRGGLPGALPDGVLLTPAVPPPTREVLPGRIEPRAAEVRGLRIGEATVDLRVSLDGSGIQVDLAHTGGGPARVRVLLPEPEGLEIRVEYVDWMRQDERRLPLEVELLPGEEEHSLFGRFRPRPLALPASPRGPLPRALERGGLWVERPPCSEELNAELEAAAAALRGALDLGGGVVEAGVSPRCEPWAPTLLHVPAEPAAARRLLAAIASRVERHLLLEGRR